MGGVIKGDGGGALFSFCSYHMILKFTIIQSHVLGENHQWFIGHRRSMSCPYERRSRRVWIGELNCTVLLKNLFFFPFYVNLFSKSTEWTSPEMIISRFRSQWHMSFVQNFLNPIPLTLELSGQNLEYATRRGEVSRVTAVCKPTLSRFAAFVTMVTG